MKLIERIRKWWIVRFHILTEEQAREYNLTWVRNVYGDEINLLNCRSIWTDYESTYRVHTLYKPTTDEEDSSKGRAQ